jgi:hypothetical protein
MRASDANIKDITWPPKDAGRGSIQRRKVDERIGKYLPNVF